MDTTINHTEEGKKRFVFDDMTIRSTINSVEFED
jgi:hypothetical protein